MDKFLSFDPLVFLGIKDLKEEEKKEVSERLSNKISQYLLIRVADEMAISEFKKTKSPEDLFLIAKTKIPDFDNKIKQYLKDFKEEFNKNLRTL